MEFPKLYVDVTQMVFKKLKPNEHHTNLFLFSVNYYLELHNAISREIDEFLYQVKMWGFQDIQRTNLTFVGKKFRYMVHSYSMAQFQIASDNP